MWMRIVALGLSLCLCACASLDRSYAPRHSAWSPKDPGERSEPAEIRPFGGSLWLAANDNVYVLVVSVPGSLASAAESHLELHSASSSGGIRIAGTNGEHPIQIDEVHALCDDYAVAVRLETSETVLEGEVPADQWRRLCDYLTVREMVVSFRRQPSSSTEGSRSFLAGLALTVSGILGVMSASSQIADAHDVEDALETDVQTGNLERQRIAWALAGAGGIALMATSY